MTKGELRKVMRWLGKRSYKARLARLGLERIQQIAREVGKKHGGRPRLPEDKASKAALRQRAYRARLKGFGIERLREIARENGKKGSRPKRRVAR